MSPRIETLSEKKLVGKSVRMSFTDNQIIALWQGFMPRRSEITNSIGSELYSLEVYPPRYFDEFKPDTAFDKWAAVEVSGLDAMPADMESLVVPAGLYAVFLYQGPASAASDFYRDIFEKWLPCSDYEPDDRPHFAVMGDKYRHEDPQSEEDIWIPVRAK